MVQYRDVPREPVVLPNQAENQQLDEDTSVKLPGYSGRNLKKGLERTSVFKQFQRKAQELSDESWNIRGFLGFADSQYHYACRVPPDINAKRIA